MVHSQVVRLGLSLPALALRHRHHHADQNHGQQNQENEPGDLPGAPRPFAGNLAGAAIHENLEQLLLVAIMRHPDRQQQVLEGDAEILRLLVRDALVVAADVAVNEPDDFGLHD